MWSRTRTESTGRPLDTATRAAGSAPPAGTSATAGVARARRLAVVGAHAEQPACIGCVGDRCIDGPVVGRGEDVPGVIEVGLGEGAHAPADPSGGRQAFEHRAHDGADEHDVRPGFDQAGHAAGGDPATADHHDPSPRQPQTDEVRRDAGRAWGRSAHRHRVPGVAAARS